MPRTSRKLSKSGVYHIILRGGNRQTIFEDDEDAIRFLRTLKRCKGISGFKLYAYCLMGNHVHLLIKVEIEELEIIMRRIGSSYVYWYNKKYERCGHLFQDRYISETVEDDNHFLATLRYIHQNPLKAGIENNIASYKWSSYSEYMKENELIDPEFVLDMFGNDHKTALDEFKAFHKISSEYDCLDVKEKKRLTDDQAREIIKRICNITCCEEYRKIKKENRYKCVEDLKKEGVSTRQLSRLTGLSRRLLQG